MSENDVLVTAVNQVVVQIRMDVKRLVCRNRPRRCRPNDDVARPIDLRAVGFFKRRFALVSQKERHIDFVTFDVLVFDFGFGQGRAAVKAPVNGFKTPVYISFFNDVGKDADFFGFRFIVHRHIRIVPVAQDA